MPSAHLNPQELKKLLHNSVDVGKETGKSPVFPLVALTVEPKGAMAYGRSRHCVGWSFTSTPLSAKAGNTVLLELDEAQELGMAVGKTSAAKDATIWVEVTPDRRLVVNYGDESIADLPSVEPEPDDIEAINAERLLLSEAGASERGFFAISTETMKRFAKIRGTNPVVDMKFTAVSSSKAIDKGNLTIVKVGDGFIGAFEAIDRPSVQDRSLLLNPEPDPEEDSMSEEDYYDQLLEETV